MKHRKTVNRIEEHLEFNRNRFVQMPPDEWNNLFRRKPDGTTELSKLSDLEFAQVERAFEIRHGQRISEPTPEMHVFSDDDLERILAADENGKPLELSPEQAAFLKTVG
jgi:hypothetical protein